ncbi:MAG: M24 family metallopeptidase, partial [Oscillospiraceae bacterium]
IVVTGPNGSLPHGIPGDRKIESGSFVTMDFGCMYGGYCSDMTRTIAVGEPTDEMKTVYETVLKAQLAGIAVSKAGVPGIEIDGAARKV